MVKTKDILLDLLVDPKDITPEKSVEIQKIIKNYPYFQQAYLLQTIYLKKSNSFYKNILHETASRTTDRRRLYEIIEIEQQVSKPLKKQAQEKKIAQETETGKPDKEKKNSQKKLKSQQKKTKKSNITPESEKKTLLETGSVKKQPDKVTPEPETDQKLSYLEWLRQLNSPKKQQKTEIFDAIEKFLKEKPKIVPQRNKNVEPPEIIEKSVEERQTLMTETLADLYVKQKKYSKAIQAFKILSLKYPKKSSYFANRIKELKQKIK